jgi:hypothetical protein
MVGRICVMSFTDSSGLAHPLEVAAETLYEAAVLGIRAFREHDCEPGVACRIDVGCVCLA